MEAYKHVVQYYETDKMGITHHSNYIRWMEEARIDFLRQLGWDYIKLEELGIVSPVVGIECKYKNPTSFYDEIMITVSVEDFKGIKLILHYEMKKGETIVLEATSTHCFLNSNGKPIRLDKEFKEFDQAIKDCINR